MNATIIRWEIDRKPLTGVGLKSSSTSDILLKRIKNYDRFRQNMNQLLFE
jgi:hypothetical protein